MIKKALVLKVSQEINIHQEISKKIVKLILDGIIEGLIKDGRVELRNFGVFQVKTKKGRTYIIPGTDKKVTVENSKSVIFKPAKYLRNLLLQK